MGKRNPNFMLPVNPPEGGYGKSYFTQCVVVVPVHSAPESTDRLHLFGVFCLEKKKRHWAFVGGDTKPSFTDGSVLDAAKRVWHEHIGTFFNMSWEDCFAKEPVTYVHHEKEGVKYFLSPRNN